MFCCNYIFICKGDGPIQAVILKRERYVFSGVHGTVAEDGEVRGDKVHEEEVRQPVEGEETEGDPGAEHPVAAREHHQDDRGALR